MLDLVPINARLCLNKCKERILWTNKLGIYTTYILYILHVYYAYFVYCLGNKSKEGPNVPICFL